MTRQCTWCDCSLGSVKPGTLVTQGICERCADNLRHSMQLMTTQEVTPRRKGLYWQRSPR